MLLKIRLENLCHTVVQDQAPLKSPAFLQKQGRIIRAKNLIYAPSPITYKLTNLRNEDHAKSSVQTDYRRALSQVPHRSW